jgi:peptidoglycan/LPS O-acetylase OafA/YrhL
MGPLGMQEFAVILLVLLCISAFVFWIRMLIEAATKEPDNGNTRLVWVIIIVFTQIIGALIYYFVRRPQRRWDTREVS